MLTTYGLSPNLPIARASRLTRSRPEASRPSGLISANATSRSILLSCARTTVLLLPSPSTRTILYRPLTKDSAGAGFGGGKVREDACEAVAENDAPARFSAAPQEPQNFTLGWLRTPQTGQSIGSGFPHSAQKFRPASLS